MPNEEPIMRALASLYELHIRQYQGMLTPPPFPLEYHSSAPMAWCYPGPIVFLSEFSNTHGSDILVLFEPLAGGLMDGTDFHRTPAASPAAAVRHLLNTGAVVPPSPRNNSNANNRENDDRMQSDDLSAAPRAPGDTFMKGPQQASGSSSRGLAPEVAGLIFLNVHSEAEKARRGASYRYLEDLVREQVRRERSSQGEVDAAFKSTLASSSTDVHRTVAVPAVRSHPSAPLVSSVLEQGPHILRWLESSTPITRPSTIQSACEPVSPTSYQAQHNRNATSGKAHPIQCSDLLVGSAIASGTRLSPLFKRPLRSLVQSLNNLSLNDGHHIRPIPGVGAILSFPLHLADVEVRGMVRKLRLNFFHPSLGVLLEKVPIIVPFVVEVLRVIREKAAIIAQFGKEGIVDQERTVISVELPQALWNAHPSKDYTAAIAAINYYNSRSSTSAPQSETLPYNTVLKLSGRAMLVLDLHRELHNALDVLMPAVFGRWNQDVLYSMISRSITDYKQRHKELLKKKFFHQFAYDLKMTIKQTNSRKAPDIGPPEESMQLLPEQQETVDVRYSSLLAGSIYAWVPCNDRTALSARDSDQVPHTVDSASHTGRSLDIKWPTSRQTIMPVGITPELIVNLKGIIQPQTSLSPKGPFSVGQYVDKYMAPKYLAANNPGIVLCENHSLTTRALQAIISLRRRIVSDVFIPRPPDVPNFSIREDLSSLIAKNNHRTVCFAFIPQRDSGDSVGPPHDSSHVPFSVFSMPQRHGSGSVWLGDYRALSHHNERKMIAGFMQPHLAVEYAPFVADSFSHVIPTLKAPQSEKSKTKGVHQAEFKLPGQLSSVLPGKFGSLSFLAAQQTSETMANDIALSGPQLLFLLSLGLNRSDVDVQSDFFFTTVHPQIPEFSSVELPALAKHNASHNSVLLRPLVQHMARIAGLDNGFCNNTMLPMLYALNSQFLCRHQEEFTGNYHVPGIAEMALLRSIVNTEELLRLSKLSRAGQAEPVGRGVARSVLDSEQLKQIIRRHPALTSLSQRTANCVLVRVPEIVDAGAADETQQTSALIAPAPSQCSLLFRETKEQGNVLLAPFMPLRPLSVWMLDTFFAMRHGAKLEKEERDDGKECDVLARYRLFFATILSALFTGRQVLVAGYTESSGSSSSNAMNKPRTLSEQYAAALAMSLTAALPPAKQLSKYYVDERPPVEKCRVASFSTRFSSSNAFSSRMDGRTVLPLTPDAIVVEVLPPMTQHIPAATHDPDGLWGGDYDASSHRPRWGIDKRRLHQMVNEPPPQDSDERYAGKEESFAVVNPPVVYNVISSLVSELPREYVQEMQAKDMMILKQARRNGSNSIEIANGSFFTDSPRISALTPGLITTSDSTKLQNKFLGATNLSTPLSKALVSVRQPLSASYHSPILAATPSLNMTVNRSVADAPSRNSITDLTVAGLNPWQMAQQCATTTPDAIIKKANALVGVPDERVLDVLRIMTDWVEKEGEKESELRAPVSLSARAVIGPFTALLALYDWKPFPTMVMEIIEESIRLGLLLEKEWLLRRRIAQRQARARRSLAAFADALCLEARNASQDCIGAKWEVRKPSSRVKPAHTLTFPLYKAPLSMQQKKRAIVNAYSILRLEKEAGNEEGGPQRRRLGEALELLFSHNHRAADDYVIRAALAAAGSFSARTLIPEETQDKSPTNSISPQFSDPPQVCPAPCQPQDGSTWGSSAKSTARSMASITTNTFGMWPPKAGPMAPGGPLDQAYFSSYYHGTFVPASAVVDATNSVSQALRREPLVDMDLRKAALILSRTPKSAVEDLEAKYIRYVQHYHQHEVYVQGGSDMAPESLPPPNLILPSLDYPSNREDWSDPALTLTVTLNEAQLLQTFIEARISENAVWGALYSNTRQRVMQAAEKNCRRLHLEEFEHVGMRLVEEAERSKKETGLKERLEKVKTEYIKKMSKRLKTVGTEALFKDPVIKDMLLHWGLHHTVDADVLQFLRGPHSGIDTWSPKNQKTWGTRKEPGSSSVYSVFLNYINEQSYYNVNT